MVTLQELTVDRYVHSGLPNIQAFEALFGILPVLPSLRTLHIREHIDHRKTRVDLTLLSEDEEELVASVRRQYPLLKIVFDKRF